MDNFPHHLTRISGLNKDEWGRNVALYLNSCFHRNSIYYIIPNDAPITTMENTTTNSASPHPDPPTGE